MFKNRLHHARFVRGLLNNNLTDEQVRRHELEELNRQLLVRERFPDIYPPLFDDDEDDD